MIILTTSKKEIRKEDMEPFNLIKNYSGASSLLNEIDEELFWEDIDNRMIDPDFERIKMYENDIFAEEPYKDKELVEIFEELNKDTFSKPVERDKKRLRKKYKILKQINGLESK